MDALSKRAEPRRCKVCGDVVFADRAKARAGMTVKHHVTIAQSDTKPLCKGSKIRHDEQPLASEPRSPSPAGAPFDQRGGAVITFVDFREAARERALGRVIDRQSARRFIRVEFRDA